VTSGGSGAVELQAEDGTIYDSTAGAVVHMHPSCLEPVPNLVMLGDLNEAAILHNLRIRYREDQIYTYIGPILVSCNPYKRMSIYTSELIAQYNSHRGGAFSSGLEPHCYEVAATAYNNVVTEGQNQSMVISGESGAGKTEATKLCVRFLAEVAASKEASGVGKEQLLLESSPIMEAFGNAKTVRNNNSSRFGKYMEVMFGPDTDLIIGGRITKYLLEKSRIVGQNRGERNFHAFYQVFCLPGADRKRLSILKASDFYYLNTTGTITADGVDDLAEFQDVCHAFDALGVTKTELDDAFQLVAACLWLGNIQLASVSDTESRVVNQDAVDQAAELLGVQGDQLAATFTDRLMIMRGQATVKVPMSKAEAEDARDALAKHLYGRLFDWITAAINCAIVTDVRPAALPFRTAQLHCRTSSPALTPLCHRRRAILSDCSTSSGSSASL